MKTPKRRKSFQPNRALTSTSCNLEEFKVERNGSWWLTETKISKEAAKRRWPQRLIKGLDCAKTIAERKKDEPVAVAHFEAIKLEEVEDSKFMQVNVGDCVEVDASEESWDHQWILEVAELFEDIEGQRLIGCQWFYKHFDTSMRMEAKGKCTLPALLHDKMLFRARPEDNATFSLYLPVDCVNRKVNVVYRRPGHPPEDCDFWWTMWYHKRYHSVEDSLADMPLADATSAEAGKTEGPRASLRPAWQASRKRARAAKTEAASTHEDLQFELHLLSCLPNAAMAVGASYMGHVGQLGDSDLVGTGILSAERVQEISRKLAAQDPDQAQGFLITMDIAKRKLCHDMGKEILKLNGYKFVLDEDSDEENDGWDEEGSWVLEGEIDSSGRLWAQDLLAGALRQCALDCNTQH